MGANALCLIDTFNCFLTMLGPMSLPINTFASFASFLASLVDIVGYTPTPVPFSFPFIRYFSRQ
jgi:hypothetical protein